MQRSTTRPVSERPRRAPALSLNAWLRWDLVRRALAELAPGSVLEVGCGQGAVGARLARLYDYRAYEPDPRSRARAVEAVGDPDRVIPGEVPSEPDRLFDVVCALEVLEHIRDDAAALDRWVRWLRPGGTILVSVPGRPHRFGPADEAVGHYRRYSRESLERRLRQAGLEDVRLWSYGFPLGYLLETARNTLARLSPPQGGRAERTAASGRWRPPPEALGWLTRAATWPFRLLQRPFVDTGPGTGLIGIGRRPS